MAVYKPPNPPPSIRIRLALLPILDLRVPYPRRDNRLALQHLREERANEENELLVASPLLELRPIRICLLMVPLQIFGNHHVGLFVPLEQQLVVVHDKIIGIAVF